MYQHSTDAFHLRAAQGWLDLGNWREANAELEQITPEHRTHPDVLKLRVEVYQAAKKWEQSAMIAESLAKITPDDPFPYVRAAFALHELKRTEEAFNILLPVADKFPSEWVIPYNLACYTAQLGRLVESEQWLKLSFVKGDKEAKQAAIDDPDLVPLREGKRGAGGKRAD